MMNNRFSMRGVSLVEALVALAVMAFGMLAVVGVQSTLRHNGDVSRQRSEATRIAQETMERQRSFVVADNTAGQFAWADIAAGNQTVDGLNAQYTVQRQVIVAADPPAKALRVTVGWTDRAGQAQSVTLSSVISSAAPGLSGTLAVRPGTAAVAPVRRPMNRHPSIPALARDFGDGRSAFVPPFRPWLVLVFNNVTGLITGVCDFGFGNQEFNNDTITPADVASCDNNTLAQLLSGFVRFSRGTGGPDLTAADVEDPIGPALRMRAQLTLTSSGHPGGSFCIDDASYDSTFNGTLQFATYFCIVNSNTSGLWSGLSQIQAQRTHVGDDDVDWEISDSAGSDRFRVCRYTSATSDAQSVANGEHPRDYLDVNGNLTNQNFVVIPSNKHCPTDGPANPGALDFVNSNTLQHQPTP